ncbi:MAG: hypothetical protein EBU90_29500 [Proteobacteria bacterium]|nr:hypothetical protein [Pseudomonadota bacterium]NBP14408.1 hypothetical protein [bacterium]
MIVLDYSLFVIPLLVYLVTHNITFFCMTLTFCLYFMYSPDLTSANYLPGYFYSPSDGTVRTITQNGNQVTISLFLSILDNHTQYIPIKSTVVSQTRVRGPFEPAFLEHSINNEQVETILKSIDYRFEYKIEQITGILTRRIKSLLSESKIQTPGTRLGFIVLGSRVDITIPADNINKLLIEPGQHISAMEKIIELK